MLNSESLNLLEVLKYIALASPLIIGTLYLYLSRLRSENSDVPAHPISTLWGHLKVTGEYFAKWAPDGYTDDVFGDLMDAIDTDVMYLDLRPASYKTVIVRDGAVAEQICRATPGMPNGLPRTKTLWPFIPLLGAKSIFSAKGDEWKSLRKRYNPGFSARHLYSLTEDIVNEVEICLGKIERRVKAGEKELEMEKPLTMMSFSIIGVVGVGERLGGQEIDGDKEALGKGVFETYEKLKEVYAAEGPNGMNPIYKAVEWYYGRVLTNQLKEVIKAKENSLNIDERSIIGLTLAAKPPLDDSIDQMKTFLFAGHDTSAVTICWSLFYLQQQPEYLAASLKEINTIFSLSDDLPPKERQSRIAKALIAHPEETINKLVYIDAVIKESLRLRPPVSSLRMAPDTGLKPFQITHNSKTYAFNNTVLFITNSIMQRNPRGWGPRASEFIPGRWLQSHDPELYQKTQNAVKEGWYRPFERGPRNCIGQTLAMVEMKIALVMLINRFNFEPEDPKPKWTWKIRGKPVDGMRMRVSLKE